MKEFKALFETLEDPLYLVDPETYDLVFLNKRARDDFGVSEGYQRRNQKCYEVVNHIITPCSFCKCKSLKKDCWKSWSYYNPRLDASFRIHDALIDIEGKTYHVIVALSNRDKGESALKVDQHFLLDLLILTNHYESVDEKIKTFMEVTRNHFDAENLFVFSIDQYGFYFPAFKVSKGEEPTTFVNPKRLIYSTDQDWEDSFLKKGYVYFPFWEEYVKEHPETKTNAAHHGAFAVVPLVLNGSRIGFYCMDGFDCEKFEKDAASFIAISGFLGGFMNRKKLTDAALYASTHDFLTKARNRTGLYEIIDKYPDSQPLGFLFMDLNGLKRVNDQKGHKAGDRYLCDVSEVLLSRYGEQACFRLGGDEFLVLRYGKDEADLTVEEAILNSIFLEKNLSVAIGSAFFKSGHDSFEHCLNIADEKMYKNKLSMKQGKKQVAVSFPEGG